MKRKKEQCCEVGVIMGLFVFAMWALLENEWWVLLDLGLRNCGFHSW